MEDTALDFLIENNAAGFLGISIRHCENKIELSQSGLINRIIVALGLQDANPACTSAPEMSLGRDLNGIHVDGDFNYVSVIGMMICLSNNTCPDISFAVNQCAQHTH
eukprot:9358756-Ditylum_brightwellii.AAC.1